MLNNTLADLDAFLADLDAFLADLDAQLLVIGGDFNQSRGPWAQTAMLLELWESNMTETLLNRTSGHGLDLVTLLGHVTNIVQNNVQHTSTVNLTFCNATVTGFRTLSRPMDHQPILFDTCTLPPAPSQGLPLGTQGLTKLMLGTQLQRLLLREGSESGPDPWNIADQYIATSYQPFPAARGTSTRRNLIASTSSFGWFTDCPRLSKQSKTILQQVGNMLGLPRAIQTQVRQVASQHQDYQRVDQKFKFALEAARQAYADHQLEQVNRHKALISLQVLQLSHRFAQPPYPPMASSTGVVHRSLPDKITLLASTHYPQASKQVLNIAPAVIFIGPAFDLVPSTSAELSDALSLLKDHRAPGLDRLTPELLKLAAQESEYFRAMLKRVIDECITLSRFPAQWKLSIENFVPKGPGSLDLHNLFRPISLISVGSKLVEGIISRRLLHELDRLGLLTFTHGAVPRTSISETLGYLLDPGRDEMQDGRCVAILKIDVSAAFSSVDHTRLVDELHRAGLRRFAHWVGAWLVDRRAQFKLEDHLSEEYNPGSQGLPHGSPLSPLLWAFYISSLFALPMQTGVARPIVEGAYVDEIYVLLSGETALDVAEQGKAWLDRLQLWSQARHMLLSKVKLLIVDGNTRWDAR